MRVFLPEVWAGDEPTRVLRRRISRKAQLVKQSTQTKNEIHAILRRNLKGRPPATDLFGRKGRRWLSQLERGRQTQAAPALEGCHDIERARHGEPLGAAQSLEKSSMKFKIWTFVPSQGSSARGAQPWHRAR